MKKIGILFGRECCFPHALIERINSFGDPALIAEPVNLHAVDSGTPADYAVVLDRISQDVPFYRAWLKHAALHGTAVVNNPFSSSADEGFFNHGLAMKLGVTVPHTVLLPSRDHPAGCTAESFRNLAYPLDWDRIFALIGWPARLTPLTGAGSKPVRLVDNPDEFFQAYHETGQSVMLLQSGIQCEDYYRCYCVGGATVHIMPYAPQNPPARRYTVERPPAAPELLARLERDARTLHQALGHDFSTVEFAIHHGVPHAVDCGNPAPETDRQTVGEANFAWIVEAAARMLMERARTHRDGADNLTWGKFVQSSAAKSAVASFTKKK